MPTKVNANSDDELNDQINDKLSQLWKSMKGKKQQLIRNLTPHYSRRTQQTNNSQIPLNISQPYNVDSSLVFKTQENSQMYRMREKLVSQASARKQKDFQVQNLRKRVKQLTNDKQILLGQLQQIYNQSLGRKDLNQSIQNVGNYFVETEKIDGRTAMFSTGKKTKDSNKKKVSKKSNKLKKQSLFSHSQINKENQSANSNLHENARTQQQMRLVELLKSTAEYRQFAYYYDCHELSYLKRLQQQHRKKCPHNLSQIQKNYWAPSQLIKMMEKLNKQEKMGLNQKQVELIISEMKVYYEAQESQKIKKISQNYQQKIRKMQRQMQNNVPYDLIRLQNAKDRKAISRKKRINSSCIKL